MIRGSVVEMMERLKSRSYDDDLEGPKILWDAIVRHVPEIFAGGKDRLIHELIQIRVAQFDSLQSFLSRFHYLNSKIKAQGVIYDDNWLLSILLQGLKSYHSFTAIP